MARLGDASFPLTCAAGQVMKWNEQRLDLRQ